MPSAQDILDAINGANNQLATANNSLNTANASLNTANTTLSDMDSKLDAIRTAILAVDADIQKVETLLQWGFTQLITLGQYTNQALFQNDKQNDTIICILEHISQNTCAILNEAHKQTKLQTMMGRNVDTLADLFAATHAEAELARRREDELRRRIEECCPPKPETPPCTYQPCPAPDQFREPPPKVQPPPDLGAGQLPR